MLQKSSDLFIICLLGTLSVISPFSIDMYLPAFLQLAHEFSIPTTTVSLTLTGYFIGLATGQLFYGPFLDRFGRKKPLAFGLGLFIFATIGCSFAKDIYSLISFRFIQGLGGCGASVASLAIVRDTFPAKQGAKILSRLFLFISISPLLAPTIGGLIIVNFGWRTVFYVLLAIVGIIMTLMHFKMPESHKPDNSISLKPGPIIREYLVLLENPHFVTYALAGAFSFAGLFTYVTGSPIIFMEGFHLSAKTYSMIFAVLATGFIGASQINVLLLRKFDGQKLFIFFLLIQTIVTLIFVAGSWFNLYGLTATLVLFFFSLSCVGITYPNAAGLAMTPFTKNTGSAAAMLGFLQLGIGAVISSGISLFKTEGSFPIIAILASTASLGLIILVFGYKRARSRSITEEA